MDLNKKLALSYYQTIATLHEDHQIYLVKHQETNRIYVKKILAIYNLAVYERLSQVPIPGIPRIIDYFEDRNQLIVIEEFISGDTLQDKLNANDLSISDITDYMMDLCNILDALHSNSPAIIHRDIKPSNIIITNYNRAVLLDFNAAKYQSFHEEADTVLLGTQGYAAPEQYGFSASTPQTDIYALGIVLKEMLSSIHCSDPKLLSIMEKCTKFNPTERFATIQEVKSLLLHYQKPTAILPTEKATLALPGFRTKQPWKMFLAVCYYLAALWLSLSLTVENSTLYSLWVERIFCWIIVMFVALGIFNYLNIQSFFPLGKHPNILLRSIGIALSISAICLLLFVMMAILSSLG